MSDKNEKLKFAVIGSGHIGKRNAEMIRRNSEAELVAMCDVRSRDLLKLDEFADVPFFKSADEMLGAGLDIDVVNVCSPNGLHAEHSIKALEMRKHVVCEKPMAISKADCEKVIYKALQVNR